MFKFTRVIFISLLILTSQTVEAQTAKKKKSKKNWTSHLIKAPVQNHDSGYAEPAQRPKKIRPALRKTIEGKVQPKPITRPSESPTVPQARTARSRVQPVSSIKLATPLDNSLLMKRMQQQEEQRRVLESTNGQPKGPGAGLRLELPRTPQDKSRSASKKLSDDRTFGPWPTKSIRDIQIDIRSKAEALPKDYSQQLVNRSEAAWENFTVTSKLFAWEAPNTRYQPLYFEDVALERYGQSYTGVRQWARSAVHFGLSSTLLSYKMAVDPPRSCEFPLGFCRPGSCGPSIYQVHWLGF